MPEFWNGGMVVEVAETAGKVDVLPVIQLLAPEQQNHMVAPSLLDGGKVRLVKRTREIETRDFRSDAGGKPPDIDCHIILANLSG